MQYTFDPVTAHYVRITDVTKPGDYNLTSQLLVMGTVVPEPATVGMVLLGGALALRRRRAC